MPRNPANPAPADAAPDNPSPALRHLSLIADRLSAIRNDLPKLIKLGEKMAAPLLAGGDLFAPDVSPFWPSEFTGRAGGLMGIREQSRLPDSEKNVAYFTLPTAPDYDPRADAKLKKLIASKAQLFLIGRPDEIKGAAPLSRFAGFTGGADPSEGSHAVESRRPLASAGEFETFVRGWITAGEMIAACTRAGRMPIIWMSVWLEGALPRNASFFDHDNRHEPWNTPLFHPRQYVPPLKPGYVAQSFLAEAEKIHARLTEQSKLLATAGQWLADAKRTNKRIWTVAVGHAYPMILELTAAAADSYPCKWGPSFSDLKLAVPDDYRDGDVALHFGYAPVDNDDVRKLLSRNLRLIHTSPYGNHPSPVKHKNFLYLDLPWRPADATVDVPAYSVRILPMSSTAQSMALFAILSEMAERMGWK